MEIWSINLYPLLSRSKLSILNWQQLIFFRWKLLLNNIESFYWTVIYFQLNKLNRNYLKTLANNVALTLTTYNNNNKLMQVAKN